MQKKGDRWVVEDNEEKYEYLVTEQMSGEASCELKTNFVDFVIVDQFLYFFHIVKTG